MTNVFYSLWILLINYTKVSGVEKGEFVGHNSHTSLLMIMPSEGKVGLHIFSFGVRNLYVFEEVPSIPLRMLFRVKLVRSDVSVLS